MFLIEIRKIAFLYQCCCVIIFAETAKPRIRAYKVLEDITSIIACQEKKLCLSYAICRHSMELYDSHVFLTDESSNFECLSVESVAMEFSITRVSTLEFTTFE